MKDKIHKLFESSTHSESDRELVLDVINQLDVGTLRIAEPSGKEWVTNAWVKEAILLYFRMTTTAEMPWGSQAYMDKIPLKSWGKNSQVRRVPGSIVRQGAFVADGAILMPSFINIGAYVGTGTMVDTWATVGSCAQIGSHVHLSGGVGIGGVLEPVQSSPVIVEDHVFIGSRAIVVEGVHLQSGCVIGAGVTLTASTKIIDVTGPKEQIYNGVVPANSVVIPGSYRKEFAAGEYSVPCALIIGKRSEKTDQKTSLNQALRQFAVPV